MSVDRADYTLPDSVHQTNCVDSFFKMIDLIQENWVSICMLVCMCLCSSFAVSFHQGRIIDSFAGKVFAASYGAIYGLWIGLLIGYFTVPILLFGFVVFATAMIHCKLDNTC